MRGAVGGCSGLRTVADVTAHQLYDRKIDSLLYLHNNENPPAQRVYDKVWSVQVLALEEIVDSLAHLGIVPIILKGADSFARSYDSRAVGLMFDVDILLNASQVQAVKRVLYSLGYEQGVFDDERSQLVDIDFKRILAAEAELCELAPFRRLDSIDFVGDELEFIRHRLPQTVKIVNGRTVVVTEIDVHHRIGVDIENEDLFTRAVPCAAGCGLALCDTDAVWFTTVKYYSEIALLGKQSLRDLAYVAPLLGESTIDWDLIAEVCTKHSFHAELYYVLSFLNHVGGGIIEPPVLDTLHPGRGPRETDWGWQLGRLFDFVDPYPGPFFEDDSAASGGDSVVDAVPHYGVCGSAREERG